MKFNNKSDNNLPNEGLFLKFDHNYKDPDG